MLNLVFVVGAYLIGSISFAVLTSKAFGLPDPRSYGSGNPGATNVLRTGKKAAAALTLLGDAAKGWLAVYLTLKFGPQDAQLVGLVASVSIAVFLGHLFPVFFRFQGGKGVATALGILLALNPWLGLAAFGTWLVVAKVFKVSSLAALIAAACAPIYTWLFHEPLEYTAVAFTLALLLIWRHKKNIQNLLAGREGKIGGQT
jgi:glycerol-3-phosphate acyltransferase PlsY